MSKSLRIIYAGTPDFSVAGLDALISSRHEVVAVYTQPDRPAGRGREPKASPVKEKALQHDIPVYQPESLKQVQAQQELLALDADLMIVTAYGLLLPTEVLQAPRLGCINIHASLLPRWRGAAPIQRAILAGDKTTGITIMQMDEGLDTGDMLALAECEISMQDTGSSLHDKLMALGAETLMTALPAIADQTIDKIPQDDENACYASKLDKAEAKIDWQQSAAEIQRAIRAYNSWPVAYCSYTNKKGKVSMLRLWQAEVLDHGSNKEGSNKDSSNRSGTQEAADTKAADAGKVIAESAAGIDVLTRDGVLRITELQAEGKRRMQVSDFLNANSLVDQVLT